MAERTVGKLNARAARVVAWCPSCHSHMHDFMDHAAGRRFDMTYLVALLHERRRELAALLVRPRAHASDRPPARRLQRARAGEPHGAGAARPGARRRSARWRLRRPGLHVHFIRRRAGRRSTIFTAAPFAAAGAAVAEAVVIGSPSPMLSRASRDSMRRARRRSTTTSTRWTARAMGLPYEDEHQGVEACGRGRARADRRGAHRQGGIEFYERAILPELKKRPNLR